MLRAAAVLLLLLALGGCSHVRFNEKERLADRQMQFDADPLAAELRGHILTPREGSIGGSSNIGAGGCGCN
jgi:hypothetical protein